MVTWSSEDFIALMIVLDSHSFSLRANKWLGYRFEIIFLPREINSAFDCESKSYSSFKEDNRVACCSEHFFVSFVIIGSYFLIV